MLNGDSNDDSGDGLESQDDVDSQLNTTSNQFPSLGSKNKIELDRINLVLAEDGNTRYDLNQRRSRYLNILFLISFSK